MLFRGSAADRRDHPPPYTEGGKSGKWRFALRIVAANGVQQADHALLDQVLMVAARQKHGPGRGADQLRIALDQLAFGVMGAPGKKDKLPV